MISHQMDRPEGQLVGFCFLIVETVVGSLVVLKEFFLDCSMRFALRGLRIFVDFVAALDRYDFAYGLATYLHLAVDRL